LSFESDDSFLRKFLQRLADSISEQKKEMQSSFSEMQGKRL
jgi:hypothetical protein